MAGIQFAGASRRSLGVTAPPVARRMASAVSRDIQALGPLQIWVTAPGVRPMRRAKSPALDAATTQSRLTLLARSQSLSFMLGA